MLLQLWRLLMVCFYARQVNTVVTIDTTMVCHRLQSASLE
jgi:hypothetical protein